MQRRQSIHSSEMIRSFLITCMHEVRTAVQAPHSLQAFSSRVTLIGEKSAISPSIAP